MKPALIRRVLVGYNGSASAQRALVLADRLARLHAQLHIVAVAQPLALGSEVEARAVIEQSRRQCTQALRAARMMLSQPVHLRVLVGQPARQIVRYAHAHDIDHIVVGYRARIRLGRATLSAIARQIIALAPCAVTAVPDVAVTRSSGRRRFTAEELASALTHQFAFKGSL